MVTEKRVAMVSRFLAIALAIDAFHALPSRPSALVAERHERAGVTAKLHPLPDPPHESASNQEVEDYKKARAVPDCQPTSKVHKSNI